MKKIFVERPEIKLVGICTRTSYQNELDKMNGKIFPCVREYFHESLFEKIPHRKKPGTTFCVYTEYDSNYQGAYTYFIGEEVTSLETPLPKEFRSLLIPKQQYVRFTTEPGAMPDVIVQAWTSIWHMSTQELGGTRAYLTDFEIYDERSLDHQNIVLDIYVGIKPS